MTQGGVIKAQRAYATHIPKWQRFQTKIELPSAKAAVSQGGNKEMHPYQRQYSHVYAQRLAVLKPRCWKAVHDSSHDEGAMEVSRVLELQEDVLSVVVGTLVKEQGDGKALHKDSRCHEDDVLLLEDESGRVELNVPSKHQLCTGIVVALLGTVRSDNGGIMKVEKIFPPSPMPQPVIQGELQAGSEDTPPHLLLVSGLECGSSEVPSLPRDMLLSFLEGHLSPVAAAKVSQVVVAGGCVGFEEKKTKKGKKKKKQDPMFSAQELDGWVAQVCAAGIPIDLLPGKNDPTTANWPQRPLHSCLFKYSSTILSRMLSRTPNPYACGLGDKLVMGSDGLNVADLQTVLLNDDKEPISELESLRATLQWGHQCPTGPDSVPTTPHAESDPMVITETPHIYFAGNCLAFDTDMLVQEEAKTRLVCVPRFADTKEVVLVNLESLDCELIRFDDQVY